MPKEEPLKQDVSQEEIIEEEEEEEVAEGDKGKLNEKESGKTKTPSSLALAKNMGIYKESSKFDTLLNSIFSDEGGYEDDPKKIDQPTNMGIIQNTLNNFNRAHPKLKIDKKLEDISADDARLIYKLDYYDQYKIEKIDNPTVALTMFHMFVNSSPINMALIVQKSINSLGETVAVDGTIGSVTVNAINKLNAKGKSKELNKKLIELRLDYERRLNNHEKYPGRRKRFKKLLKE